MKKIEKHLLKSPNVVHPGKWWDWRPIRRQRACRCTAGGHVASRVAVSCGGRCVHHWTPPPGRPRPPGMDLSGFATAAQNTLPCMTGGGERAFLESELWDYEPPPKAAPFPPRPALLPHDIPCPNHPLFTQQTSEEHPLRPRWLSQTCPLLCCGDGHHQCGSHDPPVATGPLQSQQCDWGGNYFFFNVN